MDLKFTHVTLYLPRVVDLLNKKRTILVIFKDLLLKWEIFHHFVLKIDWSHMNLLVDKLKHTFFLFSILNFLLFPHYSELDFLLLRMLLKWIWRRCIDHFNNWLLLIRVFRMFSHCWLRFNILNHHEFFIFHSLECWRYFIFICVLLAQLIKSI